MSALHVMSRVLMGSLQDVCETLHHNNCKTLHHKKCIVSSKHLLTKQNFIKFSDNMLQCLHGTMTCSLLFVLVPNTNYMISIHKLAI